MAKRDARIDAYIAKQADFAKPILKHLREVVREACPDVEETIRWGAPSFQYQGPLCQLAAFKQHCAFILWKGPLILAKNGVRADEAMGHFGRLAKVSDLPSKKTLTGYIKTAMKLNETGVKVPRAKPAAPKKVAAPAYLKTALAKNRKAHTTFANFSQSHRKEYIQWLTEAKSEDTRKRRLATAIEWMSEGKHRMWKYDRAPR
jgi:uncharacterized protein YdeI (YjbR/CyaY-like superfamily)